MRQYAGFGTAEATNERFKFLLGRGPDRPLVRVRPADADGLRRRSRPRRRRGGQGRRRDLVARGHAPAAGGPAARRGHDLDDHQRDRRRRCCCSTSWSARSRASPATQLRGTIQNDILKEYVARGTYIYPPRPSMRLIVDTFAYCAEEMPNWNTISISGYHIREAGSTAVQEVAFTLANGIAYVEAALAAGLRARRLRAAAEFLLQRPQQPLRGGREVSRRPATVGVDHARPLRRRRTRSR